ncbi:MAG TPA: DUF5996 family protein [Allosphingosinicella sp.]|nr:DUF5996 family protein [Allosphingosinicella sp.]
MDRDQRWPDIPYPEWAPTCSALHLWCQVVGKYKVARVPWLNHSWHVTFRTDTAGLATGLVDDAGGLEFRFDFRRHELIGSSAAGEQAGFPLESMSTAEFLDRFCKLVRKLGGNPEFDRLPNELADIIPFDEDVSPRPYDREAVERFHRALVSISLVLARFRSGFIGKCSPVQFFWGSFDLAVTRFSGRPAPIHPGGIPNLADEIVREAYSHEVSSGGFWPGGGGVLEPCFYAYAYPAPDGFSGSDIAPEAAFFEDSLGEFLLPYQVVRRADDPEGMLLEFLRSTYVAAAELAQWDRAALECPEGRAGLPRPLFSQAP